MPSPKGDLPEFNIKKTAFDDATKIKAP